MTTEEIVNGIKNNSISKEMGIKLIENYGIRRERNVLLELKAEAGFFLTKNIEKTIERIIAKLDKLYEITTEKKQ